MKKRFSLSRLFSSNRFVLVFAVLIAVVSWITVAMNTAQTTRRLVLDVPVDLSMQAPVLQALGLNFIDTREVLVNVEVSGLRTVVFQLEPEDFLLTVGVTHVTVPDTYEFRIIPLQRPADIEIVGIHPEVISRRLDQIDHRDFEVYMDIQGLASVEGYMVDVPRLTPSTTVRVSGPRGDLERVDRVVASLELPEALDRPWTEEVSLTFWDIAGNIIDPEGTPLSLDYENLTVQIPVLRVKTLPLTVGFHNMPAGFPEANLRRYMQTSASTITIAGPISTMQNQHEWRLGFISLRSLTPENNLFIFDIDLPSEQFINIDNLQSVAITFDSEYWDSATFNIPGEDITLINQPAGYEVTLQSVALNGVTLVGDVYEIEGLTVSDIIAEVNLNDRELILGPQSFPVRISVPNRGMIWPVEVTNTLTVYVNVTEAG